MVKELISGFFHKPDGSDADILAASARRSLYLLAFSISIPAMFVAMVAKPEAAAFLVRSEGVFAIALSFAYMIVRPGKPSS